MVHRGYKVLISGRSDHVPLYEGGIDYPEGKWVDSREGCGPLCVYAELGAAESYVRNKGLGDVPGIEIRECEYFLSYDDRVWCLGRAMYGIPKSVPVHKLPPGTVLADRIRVGKKVKA